MKTAAATIPAVKSNSLPAKAGGGHGIILENRSSLLKGVYLCLVPTTADVSGLLFLYLFCAAAETMAALAETQPVTTATVAASAERNNPARPLLRSCFLFKYSASLKLVA